MTNLPSTMNEALTAGYKIVKIRDPVTQRMGLLFTVSLPEIKAGERPRRRFMSAFEQRREIPNRALQYVIVSTDCERLPRSKRKR